MGWQKGGGKAFAIRLRGRSGRIVREAFDPAEHPWALVYLQKNEEGCIRFDNHLEEARRWARDRIRFHLGLPTSADLQRARHQRQKEKIFKTTIGDALETRLLERRAKARNEAGLDHIQNLIGLYIPDTVLTTTFEDVSAVALADAVSNETISYGKVRALRAFVGSVLKEARRSYGPLGLKLEEYQRRCAKNLETRTLPPHPEILQIKDEEFARFFSLLGNDADWRPALALRLYFATGAKLQQVLKARWSEIVGKLWYPLAQEQREQWYAWHQRLSNEARTILDQIFARHRIEKIDSPYIFPSLSNGPQMPIKTVQRFWARNSAVMGWQNLPLSQVALRYRSKINPRDLLYYHNNDLNSDNACEGGLGVSKIGKRRLDSRINATGY